VISKYCHDTKDRSAFFFKTEHSEIQCTIFGLLDPEDEGNMIVLNFGKFYQPTVSNIPEKLDP
jgi:hypothetical protein